MIKTNIVFNEEILEEFVYKITFITKAGWERYKHYYGDDDYTYRGTEFLWRHPIHGNGYVLDDAYWAEIDTEKYERTKALDKAWDEYLCKKAKEGKQNAL